MKEKIRIPPSLIGLLGTIGGALIIHHKVKHGDWWDKKMRCHGKIGAAMLVSFLIIILGMGFEEDIE